MKAFKNRLEEMAEATVNALDYSDSKVEYPDISRVQKWPKEIILPLYDLYKNTRYSELASIQKFIADEEYHISLLKKALKEYEDSDDEPKKCKSVTVII